MIWIPEQQQAQIVLVTPALADANNGNWRTAQRWARMLRSHYRVRLLPDWSPADEGSRAADLMVALHARRSAPAIQRWRAAHPQRPLVVVLTGTDLYRDIADDASAQQSLAMADHLLVLNDLGLQALPQHLRHKATVCLQSSPTRKPLAKTTRHLRAVMVGHLRAEKCPQTYMDTAVQLWTQNRRADIFLDHIGQALDPALAAAARASMAAAPPYRWLGALPHSATRRRMQQAHVLVHASRMEGGAQVIIEAITSGTPVLASRIDGNLGLLGSDYAGTFNTGDSSGLAELIQRCRDDAAMLPLLTAQCAALAQRFAPEREQQHLLQVLGQLSPPAKQHGC